MTVRNITRVYRQADHDMRARDWYSDAYSLAADLGLHYGTSGDTVAAVIAATSPINSWARNLAITERILSEHSQGRTVTSGYLSVGLDKAARLLAGEEPPAVLTGPKIRNFYLAIASAGTDPTAVVIDRHAWDIYTNTRGNKLSITPKRYHEAADAYRRAAKILGTTPSRVQSVTWTTWRRRYWAEGAFDPKNKENNS